MMRDVVAMRVPGLEKCAPKLPEVKCNTAATEKPDKHEVVMRTFLHTRFYCSKQAI